MLVERKLMVLVVSLFLTFGVVGWAEAATYYIDPCGVDDPCNGDIENPFATIQYGIDASTDNNTIIVNEGTYQGTGNCDLDFAGKAITVRSTDPCDPCVVAATIIDCQGSRSTPHRGFCFDSNETANSVVAGLTITGGYGQYVSGYYAGGAIFCEGSSPTISRCVIKDNSANESCADGGGIACYSGADATITNCIIRSNSAEWGGAISLWESSPVITNCMIYDNDAEGAGGIGCYEDADADITNCLLYGNTGDVGGGAIYTYDSAPTITNCTISKNEADSGGGIYNDNDSASPEITNTIIWNNSNAEIYNSSSDPNISYCDIEGCYDDEGTWDPCMGTDKGGNINSYPFFQDFAGDDFHLTWCSPCIDRGDPCSSCAGQIDIDGQDRLIDSQVEMGADEHYTNLVPNPGFELGGGGWKGGDDPCIPPPGSEDPCVPLYWWDYWTGGTKTIDPCEARSGDYSWRFFNDTGVYVGAWSDYMPVEHNRLYGLSGWLKCDEATQLIHFERYEYDENYNCTYSYDELIDQDEPKPTTWTQYSCCVHPYKEDTKYFRIAIWKSQYGSTGTVWWDDFCLREITEYLPPYGKENSNDAKTVDFGEGTNENWVVNLDDMSDPCTDPCDSNIQYRELKPYSWNAIDIQFPAFNQEDPCDPNSFPATPMLLEVVYKDTIESSCGDYPFSSSDRVFVKSRIDYINPDDDYLLGENPTRYSKLGHLGDYQDGQWKHFQWAFGKNEFQLLRVIDGCYTIRIESDQSDPCYDLPIDYVSLRKITQAEYEAFVDKQQYLRGLKEAQLPADSPEDPNYDDPNLVVFTRDIMRPVYRHSRPDPCEISEVVAGFGVRGQTEPLSFSLYSEAGMENLTVEPSTLTHKTEDANIPVENISVYQVIYAEVKASIGKKSYALYPDRLKEFDTISVAEDTSERVWLKITVPDDPNLLPAGLYSGTVTIKQNGVEKKSLDLELEIYDIDLNLPDYLNPVYSDPYAYVYSEDINVTFAAYRQTQFDPRIYSSNHKIEVIDPCDPCDPCSVEFDTTNYEAKLDRMIDEGFTKDKVMQIIDYENYEKIYEISTGEKIDYSSTTLWTDLEHPKFKENMTELIEIYQEIGDERGIEFIFQIGDEPGTKPTARIRTYQIFNIIQNADSPTTVTYYTTCDDEVDPGDDYIIPEPNGPNIPPLTEKVNYKVFSMSYAGEGYKRFNDPCDPNYYDGYGEEDGYYLGYYTTNHSHLRNPVYNRFLHGLYAFRMGSKAVSAYAMGTWVYGHDPYDHFRMGANCYFSSDAYYTIDYMYAYPTWSGEFLYTIGGLEGIREGIKDGRYIATLIDAIAQDPNTAVAIEAQDYLDDLKDRMVTEYSEYYNAETDLGYYAAILEDVSETQDDDDFEAFTAIRRKIADYIVAINSEYTVKNLTQDTWHNSVQDAIDDADPCDVIEVPKGTYEENSIDFDGKAITVRSTDPCDPCVVAETIIDANSEDHAFYFHSSENANSVLSGFTITGADSSGDYAVYCDGSGPTISWCVVNGNYGGINCTNSSAATISNNKIASNSYYGIYVNNSQPTIRNNWIYDTPYCCIALTGSETDADILNSTIIYSYWGIRKLSGTPAATITNCILWGGTYSYNPSFHPTYSRLKPGDPDAGSSGNITDDPCFVDASGDDYHLDYISPCIDAGDPCGDYDGQVDIDNESRVRGEEVDMGADEVIRVHNDTQEIWYGSIQDAIDDADPCDVIEVPKGTYYENSIDFDGKAITVRSTDPCDWDVVAETVIDADSEDYAFYFHSSEDANSVLSGFTITGADTHGVYCTSSSPTVNWCLIKGNVISGIYATSSAAPNVSNNKIKNNSVGVYVAYAQPTIQNNWIYKNSNYGMIVMGSTTDANIINNTIVDNTNYGIYQQSSPPTVTITNCILWGNGDDLYGNLSATYSCIEDPCDANGTGNITDDPCFVNAAGDDYHLDPNSPCIDMGYPDGNYEGQVDIDNESRVQGEEVDMGGDEAE